MKGFVVVLFALAIASTFAEKQWEGTMGTTASRDVRLQAVSSSSSSGVAKSSTAASSSTGVNALYWPYGVYNFTRTNFTVPGAKNYCGTDKDTPQSMYDWNHPVCIVVGGTQKVYVMPQVDEYSLISIEPNGTLCSTDAFFHPDMWVAVEMGGVISEPRYRSQTRPELINVETGVDRFDPSTQLVVPFFVAIIHLDNGIVRSIEWDDGCFGCAASKCVDNVSCGVLSDDCQENQKGGTAQCNVKVYIAWDGTDSLGRYLISSGKRPSRFRQYSMNSAFTNAYDTYSGSMPDNPFGDIK